MRGTSSEVGDIKLLVRKWILGCVMHMSDFNIECSRDTQCATQSSHQFSSKHLVCDVTFTAIILFL